MTSVDGYKTCDYEEHVGLEANLKCVAHERDRLAAELARVQQSHDYWNKKHDGLKIRILELEAIIARICIYEDALNKINEIIYGAGAPSGSENYFKIRQLAVT